jgi:hypothetical protein
MKRHSLRRVTSRHNQSSGGAGMKNPSGRLNTGITLSPAGDSPPREVAEEKRGDEHEHVGFETSYGGLPEKVWHRLTPAGYSCLLRGVIGHR